ncbi:MAG: hypothetical protein ABIK08_03555 [Pseudomonadota bacterium]
MNNKSLMLSDVVRASGRYTRSVSLVRDYQDPTALDGYIVTPTVLEVLTRVGAAIRGNAAQRAWKIIGPYGSGKSALGLFLSHLVGHGQGESAQAHELLNKADATIAGHFEPSLNLLPVFVLGTRGLFAHEAAKALSSAPKRFPCLKKLDLSASEYDGKPLEVEFPTLLVDYVTDARKAGYGGLLFIIDEMGKFIEHAALNPESGDLYSFQQLAEMACGRENPGISVVAMQHQQFEDYANAVGRMLSDEWGKVSSRFEEIIFEEPLEQCATLMAETLVQDVAALKKLAIPQAAEALYKDYFKRQRVGGVANDAAEKFGPRLYPLHPATLIALAHISKRLGQSERSIFAFLNSAEPNGFGDFTRRIQADKANWFRLANLFDYLVGGGTLRFRNLEASRRWEFALARVHASVSLTGRQIGIVKTVAVEECFGPFSHGGLTTAGLLLTAGGTGVKEMGEELHALVEAGVLLKRQSTGEFVLQTDRELNIEALYQEAIKNVDHHATAIRGLRDIIASTRVIAHRHYQETGTLRTAGMTICRAGDVNTLPVAPDVGESDGEIVLVLCSPKEFRAGQQKLLQQEALANRFRVVRFVNTDEHILEQLFQFACWNMVYQGLARRNVDPWGLRFIERQLAATRRYIEVSLVSQLEMGESAICSPWYYESKKIKGASELNASQVCSAIFDRLYSAAPRMQNELINRRKPSSAIVLARQRLIEMAMANPKTPLFGIEGFPPERLIYMSIAAASGLHAGEQGFKEPDKIKKEWKPVFDLIASRLQGLNRVSVEELLKCLAAPPIGLRSGVALTVIALYIVAYQRFIALFERNSFIPAITIEHFTRMFRNPKLFEFRQFTTDRKTTEVLKAYIAMLNSVGVHTADDTGTAEVAREVIRWYVRLPQFAKVTTSVSALAREIRDVAKKATDPSEMLFTALPTVAKNHAPAGITDPMQAIRQAMVELSTAERQLRNRIVGVLGGVFAISGDLATVRQQLMQECSSRTSELIDFKLKAFVLRCADAGLTDERWLESVASLLTQRPLESWDDNTPTLFEEESKAMAIRFRKWVGLMLHRGKQNAAPFSRFLSVSVLDSSGHDRTEIVPTTPELIEESGALAQSILQQVKGDLERAAALLATALSELTKGKDKEPDQGKIKHA